MEEKKELIRAFVCIDFPDAIVKEVARIQEQLENLKFTGKMTELENLHLTLKFLGEIEKEKIEEVRKKLGKIKFQEFEAKMSEIGSFSRRGNPRIVWIKIGGKEIFELQEKIDGEMKELGFKMEERFMSHMTIARVKYAKDKKGFFEYVKNLGIKEIKFKVDKFILKRSELRESGPIYTNIEEYWAVKF